MKCICLLERGNLYKQPKEVGPSCHGFGMMELVLHKCLKETLHQPAREVGVTQYKVLGILR